MIKIFTVNGFQENTYLVFDKNKKAVIIDPGFSNQSEKEVFDAYIKANQLDLVDCWLTHAHIDHVLGLNHIYKTYGLTPKVHVGEEIVYNSAPQVALAYGMSLEPLPKAEFVLDGKSTVEIGSLKAKQLFAPGHSPASVCFYFEEHGFVIAGDVLFRDSIGRTDLPGGDHETLLKSIKDQLYVLPEETDIYPGHGPKTTIGHEQMNNPFVRK